MVAVAGSSPSAVLADMVLAVARIDPAAGMGLAAGSRDPEEDSPVPEGGSSRLVAAGAGRRGRHLPDQAGECRSRCKQPEEAEAGCTGVDLACRTLCLRSLVVACATER